MPIRDMLRAAFGAKDQKAFDALLTTLDEEGAGGPAITVHNHMPEGAEQDRRGRDDEPPPWFKKHAEETDARFKALHDAVAGLMPQEEEEEGGSMDRRGKDKRGRDRGRDGRSVHDRLDALHDAVSSMLDWARDAEEKIESKAGGDRRGRDNEGEYEESEEVAADKRGKDAEEGEPEREASGEDKRGKDKRGKDKSRSDDEKILGELEFEAPPGTGDRARRATDSAVLSDPFQDAVARAEVLAPGIRLPAYDRAAPPAKTLTAIHGLRCAALDLAWGQPATRGIIEAALGGPGRALDTKRMSPSQVRTLFNAVAAAAGESNNARARDGSGGASFGGSQVRTGRVQTLSDLNRLNAERFHPANRPRA